MMGRCIVCPLLTSTGMCGCSTPQAQSGTISECDPNAVTLGLSDAPSEAERTLAMAHLCDHRSRLILAHQHAWDDIYSLEGAAMLLMRGLPTIYTRDYRK